MPYTFKQLLGAALLDWPRFEWHLHTHWACIRNRGEAVRSSRDGPGLECLWRWTSDLHIAKVYPRLGQRLLHHCLKDWPVAFGSSPWEKSTTAGVSFVIGHRGTQRVPHLMATLATIAAQRGVACECIVVEQSVDAELRDRLPKWVHYVHTPLPDSDLPYCRAWALNVGARVAKGGLLVLHDGDILVPQAYASELWARHQKGFQLINLKRFIFYLSENRSIDVQSKRGLDAAGTPEAIMQNNLAGASVAVDRDAYLAIGGYDESFVGWGGEDNEFWERAATLRVWPYAHLPMVHLWHPAQPQKADSANPTLRHYSALSTIPPVERIRTLVSRDFGHHRKLSA